ncbi:MAG: hypothetical protein HY962_09250 [Ignavibacteriae bacterium]|nr:hypothetical protein [Ignavibacteriota bacterium]
MKLTVNAKGNVMKISADGNRELFPASAPAVDTFHLMSQRGRDDTLRHVVTRRFDTTLFDRSVHAYSFVSPPSSEESAHTETTVADSFGLVRTVYIGYADTISLRSCVIDGRMYNWEHTTRRYMELCDGNVYQWHAYGRNWLGQTYDYHQKVTLRADTIIDGRQYFSGSLFGTIHQGDSGLYQLPLASGAVPLLLPGNATIGTPTGALGPDARPGIVVDTATRWYEGRERHFLNISLWPTMGEGAGYTQLWAEGIGLVSLTNFDSPWGGRYALNYANICGTKLGTYVGPTSMESATAEPSMQQLIHPNPFAATVGTNIRFTLDGTAPRHVILSLHDALGRHVATLLDQDLMPGEHHVPFKPVSIAPGFYLSTLCIGGRTVTTTLVAVR